ncbi:alpha/beta hydrolase family protein [Catenuloplanes atrovinosus]|uniref:Fermentation-respiration switch protein FrsA (DUF1100 family) n=1 Tax=Catenuloplanes atrovinosus TaxID=137266 RepID=A0AAE4CGS0_9ACTN|nr:chlorophyllase [Catenuloplanes atrovinosus]MDR7280980.1 fermentation-respiration switch protein FrsA (DUF1100 family) [Catenuloplanes atrovinosus]
MYRRRLLALAVPLMLLPSGCALGIDDRPGLSRPAAADPTPADAGPPPPGVAPAESFAVGRRTLDLARGDRKLPTTIWYPNAETGEFPVVVFSHGLGGRPADYTDLLTRWASAGFVVVAPAYPNTTAGSAQNALDVLNQPADASAVLTAVLALNDDDGDRFAGRLLTDRVAAAGHSAGGITTIGEFTRGRDARLDAGIVLAGSTLGVGTGFSGKETPMLFVHGELDQVVPYSSGKSAFDAVPWPKAMLTLPQGDHVGALSAGSSFDVLAGTTTEFLRWSLYGDEGALERLPEAAAEGDIAELDDQF